MRWKSFLFVLGILIVLLATFSFADTDLKLTPIKNNIDSNEQASFKLEITNNADTKQRYSIYSLRSVQRWNVDPSPLRDKIIELAAGKSYTTTIIAQPLEDFPPGIYNLHVSIESDLGEEYSQMLKVYIKPEVPVDYLPSIKVDIDMDEKINPKEPVSIKLLMENKNPLNLSDLTIKIQNNIPEFSKEVNVNLPPLEKKTVEFSVTPNKFQQPGKHVLFFVFINNDQQVKLMDKNIEFITLLTPFSQEVASENKFLKSFKGLTIKNEGNIKNTQEVRVPISFWQSLFATNTENTKTEEGQRYLVWEVTLSPDESVTKYYVINYRLILYLTLIVLLLVGFYLYVQTPILVRKEALTTKSDQEGALSEIKITLEIRNKTKKVLKNIKIIDTVPGIANIEKNLELGTLKPQEIRHTKKGTKVVWSLAELDALEHRLITYKIKAKLNILGTFNLPRSNVEYTKRNGKKGKIYSNTFRLSN